MSCSSFSTGLVSELRGQTMYFLLHSAQFVYRYIDMFWWLGRQPHGLRKTNWRVVFGSRFPIRNSSELIILALTYVLRYVPLFLPPRYLSRVFSCSPLPLFFVYLLKAIFGSMFVEVNLRRIACRVGVVTLPGIQGEYWCIVIPVRYELNLYMLCRRK
jgi:hypothetical protein